MKMWEDAWLKITKREVLVMESNKESPKRSHPYTEIRDIRKCSYNANHPHCISIKVEQRSGVECRRIRLLSGIPGKRGKR